MAEQLDDEALNIYTDGSQYSHPRRGGVGFRFVMVDDAGEEVVYDSDLPGYREATNNQMEIKAAVEALREAIATWSPGDIERFKKVVIYSDSDYLVSGYQSARFGWPRDGWRTAAGRPVENAELWQDLTRAAWKTGKRVEVKWIRGKKGRHAKAVDKLAKQSAQNPLNPPLAPSRVRRRRSSQQVAVGSVGMEGQTMTIYVRTDKWMPVQKCYRYRYEVVSEESAYCGLVDDIFSDRQLILSAGHAYSVRVNDDPGNPCVLEVFDEIV